MSRDDGKGDWIGWARDPAINLADFVATGLAKTAGP